MALATEESKARYSTAAFPNLFKFREVGTLVFLVTMSGPCSTSLFTTRYKRLPEGVPKAF
jgi:hypothetical protein